MSCAPPARSFLALINSSPCGASLAGKRALVTAVVPRIRTKKHGLDVSRLLLASFYLCELVVDAASEGANVLALQLAQVAARVLCDQVDHPILCSRKQAG